MDELVRHLLMVAYHFPPQGDVAGGLRSEKLAKYLPEQGWMPTVLTLRRGLGIHVQPRSDGVYEVPSWLPLQRPFRIAPYGWVPAVCRAARRLAETAVRPTVAYVSCPPFPPALTMDCLRATLQIPVVLDLRDAWSLGPYQDRDVLNRWVHRHWTPVLERRAVNGADLLVLNTQSSLNAYRRLYPELATRMRYLPNGFDEDDFAGFRLEPPEGPFTLLYPGQFWVSGRDPRPILQAMRQMLAAGYEDVRLRILGDTSKPLHAMVAELGLARHVMLEPPVAHAEAVMAMGRCHALLLYQADAAAAATPVAGKTFEYLRAGRPVLAVTHQGDNLDLAQRYAPVLSVADPARPEDIARAWGELHARWRRGEDQIADPSPEFLGRFSRRALAAELASWLTELSTRNQFRDRDAVPRQV